MDWDVHWDVSGIFTHGNICRLDEERGHVARAAARLQHPQRGMLLLLQQSPAPGHGRLAAVRPQARLQDAAAVVRRRLRRGRDVPRQLRHAGAEPPQGRGVTGRLGRWNAAPGIHPQPGLRGILAISELLDA